MSDDLVLTDLGGGVLIATKSRPSRLNAADRATAAALHAAAKEIVQTTGKKALPLSPTPRSIAITSDSIAAGGGVGRAVHY